MQQYKLTYVNQTLRFYQCMRIVAYMTNIYKNVKTIVERLPKTIVKELIND